MAKAASVSDLLGREIPLSNTRRWNAYCNEKTIWSFKSVVGKVAVEGESIAGGAVDRDICGPFWVMSGRQEAPTEVFYVNLKTGEII